MTVIPFPYRGFSSGDLARLRGAWPSGRKVVRDGIDIYVAHHRADGWPLFVVAKLRDGRFLLKSPLGHVHAEARRLEELPLDPDRLEAWQALAHALVAL
jgi:hypothetical protein